MTDAPITNIIQHPRMLSVSGVVRQSPNSLEIKFDRAVTDDQMINFWLAVKGIRVASVRPAGWEPTDKSNPESWEAGS